MKAQGFLQQKSEAGQALWSHGKEKVRTKATSVRGPGLSKYKALGSPSASQRISECLVPTVVIDGPGSRPVHNPHSTFMETLMVEPC